MKLDFSRTLTRWGILEASSKEGFKMTDDNVEIGICNKGGFRYSVVM